MENKECVGRVIALFKKEKIRKSYNELNLDKNGVLGDKFYAKDVSRSVLLSSLYSYNKIKKENIDISFGALDENILIDFNPYSLKIGTKIEIGEVLFKISQPCTICGHLSSIDKKVPKLLKEDRGVFIQVIKGGAIFVDDRVFLIEKKI